MIRRPIFILMSLLIPTASYSYIYLNDVMSTAEQEKTGVFNLTVSQRLELEKWINEYFVPKTQAQMGPGNPPLPSGIEETNEPLTFDLVIDGGKFVQLSDGTLWEIAPDDISATALWLIPFPIVIKTSGDNAYPHLLVDQNTGKSVKAKQVERRTELLQPD